jgi:all-trans-8'-apo-beta-carotenal 15,15'-oxygenase
MQGLGADLSFVHDMLVTPHWYIVVMGPVSMDMKGFVTDYLIGKRSLGELLQFSKNQPSKVSMVVTGGKG